MAEVLVRHGFAGVEACIRGPREKFPGACLRFGLQEALPPVTIEFDDWYRNEYPRLVNTVALATGDRGVATESASEACVRALARWDRVQHMEHPGAWVYKVALNDARRRLKGQARERRTLVDQAASSTATALPVERDHELWEAVSRLPDRTRHVVVLRYVADLTEPAIARALGVRRGTVATMLHRAHERLADELRSSPNSNTGEYTHAFQ